MYFPKLPTISWSLDRPIWPLSTWKTMKILANYQIFITVTILGITSTISCQKVSSDIILEHILSSFSGWIAVRRSKEQNNKSAEASTRTSFWYHSTKTWNRKRKRSLSNQFFLNYISYCNNLLINDDFCIQVILCIKSSHKTLGRPRKARDTSSNRLVYRRV